MKLFLNVLLFSFALLVSSGAIAAGGKSKCETWCPDGSACSITGINVKCYCDPSKSVQAQCTYDRSETSIGSPLEEFLGTDEAGVSEE